MKILHHYQTITIKAGSRAGRHRDIVDYWKTNTKLKKELVVCFETLFQDQHLFDYRLLFGRKVNVLVLDGIKYKNILAAVEITQQYVCNSESVLRS